MKLWLYTNYDCNLRCTYCVAESSPQAPRRRLKLETVKQLVDEAVALGFEAIYFTGGEPMLLEDIYAMLDYSARRAHTILLTNGMLLHGKRLERLSAINRDRLAVQVSLDGSRPEHHDPYRGAGTWTKTVEGIHNLQAGGFHVRLSTTETPANTEHLAELCAFHLSLGIPEGDHLIRPLARRGFSTQGLEISKNSLAPEITVNKDGVFWHPLSTGADMQVSERIFPFSEAVCRVLAELEAAQQVSPEQRETFQ
jgi:MoaA/NifB/PqqE/SkfB family radical SAM enzyme